MTGIQGYNLGEINCKAAFTSEFALDYDGPLQNVVNMQEQERRQMDDRPGMYLKYLPCRYDAVTGSLLVGGGYLFDSQDHVKEYVDWTTHTFEVGEGETKSKFWSRPLFKDVKHRCWDVIGACNFTLPDQHDVIRFQRWTYSEEGAADAATLLKKMYPKIRDTAKKQGSGAIWLLIRPSDQLIGLVTASSRTNSDSHMTGYRSIADLERQPPFDEHFPSNLRYALVYDRISFLLTIWLPLSRRAGGVPQVTPNFPLLPAVTLPPQTT
ncbi:hypothetical protein N7510_000116 [Penicillium lagena]|uniref:uncharacterized protein n=1 Tax=Penicillium lagena TaxID=94218 RepID=UPI002541725B|nr:uncharacterized protein N7510_000116 [Penicillium lagena]KAJ5623807.1 hypothetical protein N7510_000116 [Penicillium lagena]